MHREKRQEKHSDDDEPQKNDKSQRSCANAQRASSRNVENSLNPGRNGTQGVGFASWNLVVRTAILLCDFNPGVKVFDVGGALQFHNKTGFEQKKRAFSPEKRKKRTEQPADAPPDARIQ